MARVPRAREAILFILLCHAWSGHAAIIAAGIKLQVSQVKVEKKKTFFKHKNSQLEYSGILNVISKPDKTTEIFLTFDEFKTLLRENKIALGGVAGGGGGK